MALWIGGMSEDVAVAELDDAVRNLSRRTAFPIGFRQCDRRGWCSDRAPSEPTVRVRRRLAATPAGQRVQKMPRSRPPRPCDRSDETPNAAKLSERNFTPAI